MAAVEITIRDTSMADIEELAREMRAVDRAEIAAAGHAGVFYALRRSFNSSTMCWSAFADGKLGCVIGVSPISMAGGLAAPWMLGTPVLERHSRVLVRMAPAYIARMLKAYPHLINAVHAENASSIRWLKRLGFVFGQAHTLPSTGAVFRIFEMKADHV